MRLTAATLAVAALLAAAFAQPARAAQFRSGQAVLLDRDELVHDDLYASARSVDILGTVDGDLVIAGGNLKVQGDVTGDVIAAGGRVTLLGHVGGSVRAAGGNVVVGGRVEHDVVAAGGDVTLQRSLEVGRDVMVGAGSADVGGNVARNAILGIGNGTLRGTVGGNVRGRVDRLVLADSAVIDGNLAYVGRHAVVRESGAQVRGSVEHVVGMEPSSGQRVAWAGYRWMKQLLGFWLFGLLFLVPFHEPARQVVATMRGSAAGSAAAGIALAIGLPFLCATACIAGFLFGGWWIGAGGLIVFMLALALGVAGTGYRIGLALRGNRAGARGWVLFLGLLVLTLVGAIPFLGFFVILCAAVYGLGAMALTMMRARRAVPSTLSPLPADPPRA